MLHQHFSLTHVFRFILPVAMAAAATAAFASFHTFEFDQVYSNADGTVQFVVLREAQGSNGQNRVVGAVAHQHARRRHQILHVSRRPAQRRDRRQARAVGTQGLAALGFIAPDYVIPNGFLATDGATLDYAGADTVTYASLPHRWRRRAQSRRRDRFPIVATNFAGQGRVVSRAAGDVRRVLQRGPRPLFHQQPAARHRRAGHRPHCRLGAHRAVVQASSPARRAAAPASIPCAASTFRRQHGNSHFFSASPAECNIVQQKSTTDPNYSGYVFESPSVFFVALPDTTTGACPAGTAPVYRLWNQRADSNHRYTGAPAIKAQMIAAGYVAEGYGPNAVIMCAPSAGTATLTFVGGLGRARRRAGQRRRRARRPPTTRASSRRPTSVNVGARAGAGEAIAFSRDRPVALQPALWATRLRQPDRHRALRQRVRHAGHDLGRRRALRDHATDRADAVADRAADLHRRAARRAPAPLEIVDATANPKAATWTAFTCGAANASVTSIQADIGVRAGPHQRLPGRPGRRLDVARQRLRRRRRLRRHRVGIRRRACSRMSWATISAWSTSTT